MSKQFALQKHGAQVVNYKEVKSVAYNYFTILIIHWLDNREQCGVLQTKLCPCHKLCAVLKARPSSYKHHHEEMDEVMAFTPGGKQEKEWL